MIIHAITNTLKLPDSLTDEDNGTKRQRPLGDTIPIGFG
jgi:hypothetical protein